MTKSISERAYEIAHSWLDKTLKKFSRGKTVSGGKIIMRDDVVSSHGLRYTTEMAKYDIDFILESDCFTYRFSILESNNKMVSYQEFKLYDNGAFIKDGTKGDLSFNTDICPTVFRRLVKEISNKLAETINLLIKEKAPTIMDIKYITLCALMSQVKQHNGEFTINTNKEHNVSSLTLLKDHVKHDMTIIKNNDDEMIIEVSRIGFVEGDYIIRHYFTMDFKKEAIYVYDDGKWMHPEFMNIINYIREYFFIKYKGIKMVK